METIPLILSIPCAETYSKSSQISTGKLCPQPLSKKKYANNPDK